MSHRDSQSPTPQQYTMKLIIDAATPPPVSGRSNTLCMDLDAQFVASDGTYEANPGDSFKVEAHLCYPTEPGSEPSPELSILGLNLVSWTSPRQSRISSLTGVERPNPRIFDGMLRTDADRPDRDILARGQAVFERAGEADVESHCQLCGKRHGGAGVRVVRYCMTSPSRLFLERQGLFGFLVSLNVVDAGGQVIPYILDPELDVGGTYPPDDGDGPLPTS